MIADATDAADGHAHIPATVGQILQDALALRDARDWLLRSCRQQDRDPVGILVPLLTSPAPVVADLVIPGQPNPGWDAGGLIVPGLGVPPSLGPPDDDPTQAL